MSEKPIKRLVLKPKSKNIDNDLDMDDEQGSSPIHSKDATDAALARRKSEVLKRKANLEVKSQIAKSDREQISEYYYDQNNEEITKEQMKIYQEIVGSFYENFVVLTDDQIKDLESQLPKKINNTSVKCGHRAVFPPVLDTERKKLSRGRVISKANRLRYIESEDVRGLRMPEDIEELLNTDKKSKRYEQAKVAKKDLVRTLMSLNHNDYEMCEFVKVNPKELSQLKKEVIFEELSVNRLMTNEELYVQYKLQQMEVVKDLDVMIERFKNSKQLTALASALKTKSEIYDRIIEKGYEFGVISKSIEKSAIIIGNVDITTANLDQIKSEAIKVNKEINKLLTSENFLEE